MIAISLKIANEYFDSFKGPYPIYLLCVAGRIKGIVCVSRTDEHDKFNLLLKIIHLSVLNEIRDVIFCGRV